MLYRLFLSVWNLITSIMWFLCGISPDLKLVQLNSGFQISSRVNRRMYCWSNALNCIVISSLWEVLLSVSLILETYWTILRRLNSTIDFWKIEYVCH